MTTKAKGLIAELRGFADGSESARATLMRDAATALEETVREMHARELHHFETEQAITEALRIDTHYMHPDARRVLTAAIGEGKTDD